MCMKYPKPMVFSQNNEEAKVQSSINLNTIREEPQRFYEQHEVEQMHK